MRNGFLIWQLTAFLLTTVSHGGAQQTGRTYRIGFMSVRSETGSWDEAFKLGCESSVASRERTFLWFIGGLMVSSIAFPFSPRI
jgi:hypothetical protein